MRRLFYVFQFILVLTLCLQESILACSCPPRDFVTPCERYTYADVIFIGHRISGGAKKEFTPNGLTRIEPPVFEGRITFEITEAFKGISSKTIIVNVDPVCGGAYGVRNEEWLIYATRDKQGELNASIGICSSSIRLTEGGKSDLKFLRQTLPGMADNWIGGTVEASYSSYPDDPSKPFHFDRLVRNVIIKLISEGKSIETKTDSNGNYIFENLTSGEYLVEVVLPDGYSTYKPQYGHDPIRTSITVKGKGCRYASFYLLGNDEIARQIIKYEEKLNRKTPWIRYGLFTILGLLTTAFTLYSLKRF